MEAGRPLNSRLLWSKQWVSGQPGLFSETLSHKKGGGGRIGHHKLKASLVFYTVKAKGKNPTNLSNENPDKKLGDTESYRKNKSRRSCPGFPGKS